MIPITFGWQSRDLERLAVVRRLRRLVDAWLAAGSVPL